jgi:uncharacterized membrane protein
MARHEESIVIRRPRADVYAYMDDIDLEREWQPHLLEAEQQPDGPTAVGTRRRYVSDFLGRRIENTYVVVELEPESRIVLESTPDSVVRARNEIRWTPRGDETVVTMTMEGTPTGMLRFVPRSLLEATFEKELRETLSRLRDRLEA